MDDTNHGVQEFHITILDILGKISAGSRNRQKLIALGFPAKLAGLMWKFPRHSVLQNAAIKFVLSGMKMNPRFGVVFVDMIIPVVSRFVLSKDSFEERAYGWNFLRSVWLEYPDVILGHNGVTLEVLEKVNEITGMTEMEYGGEVPDRDIFMSDDTVTMTKDQSRLLIQFIRCKR
jgi:hypothetical protein